MTDLFLIFAVTVPTVTIGLWWALQSSAQRPVPPVPDHPTIVFRDGILEHATPSALERFPITIGAHDWDDLCQILRPEYPDFPPQLLPSTCNARLIHGPKGDVRIKWHRHGATITFYNADSAVISTADLEDLRVLRQITDSIAVPMWKTDTAGDIVWHNAAYNKLRSRVAMRDGTPPSEVFNVSTMTADTTKLRVKITLDGPDPEQWFSVKRRQIADGVLYHAESLHDLVRAEEAQRDFVQTLAKTFAHLPIGLAIFNRDRQLALFNPALTDLTGLSVSFLSPRPTIESFFDAMRENRRMPEPKNYRTWRQRMADLISAAETGRFEETWSLDAGQTFRVTGRPHPDGAIAFLIEDISAEISLTRNFRAELELGQSLADTFEDALAVFSQTGLLTFSNKAYDLLWGFDGDSTFADVTINDAITLWTNKAGANPKWHDVYTAVMRLTARTEWSMPVTPKGHAPMQCRVVPIASGATVVRFSRQSAKVSATRALPQSVSG